MRVDAVLAATGRKPNTAGLGLEALGVGSARDGAIVVDDWSQTAVPSIYAVGDVTDRAALTPVAIRDGHAFADTVFGGRPTPADHALIPTAVFTQPEIGDGGAVGGGGARARAGRDLPRDASGRCYHALAGRDERMLMKLVVAGGRPAGCSACHIVGHGAARDDPARRDRARHGRDQGGLRPDASRCIRPRPRNWSRCGAPAV